MRWRVTHSFVIVQSSKRNNNKRSYVGNYYNGIFNTRLTSYPYSFNSDDIHLNGGGRPQLTDSMVRPSCYDTTILVYKLYKKHGSSNNNIRHRRIPSLVLNNNKSCGKIHNQQLVEFSVVRHQVSCLFWVQIQELSYLSVWCQSFIS